jgi:hypothetical protein
MNTARSFSLLNDSARLATVVAVTEQIRRWRRERRVLARVTRAAWRLEQAEVEQVWALASARAEGVSIRTLAGAAGLSPTRVHQLVTDADPGPLEAELGELRAAGWPSPEDPDAGDDTELGGRDQIADRLIDEVDWLRRCAGWVTQLGHGTYPPATNLRPTVDHPQRAIIGVDHDRLAAVLERIAADVDELARARRVADLTEAAVRDDARAELRRRLAEPDLDFREFCRRTKTPAQSSLQGERAWDAFQAERYRRGERDDYPAVTENPFRHQQRWW